MTEPLSEDWPLIEVSPESQATGEAVYIIKAVDGKRVPAFTLRLRPRDAGRVRAALRAGFAQVWDEGYSEGHWDGEHADDSRNTPSSNPYRPLDHTDSPS
ncbi:hypothetical protein [Jiangella anatolica]|uniref:Uncharacterized protein n=1 Tax=Jiangella anatolica TaxID=2670374 RepID=A0A2W2C599_9ACTN|nr:hypothetical protein [Jiangella anatolica]PZF83217.1 hypothetical protein C1I92_13145 [Jiangella anatolica]